MSPRPRVSVVIPTRDRPEALQRAVDSVLSQSFEHIEIVVVDDASVIPAEPAVGESVAHVTVVRNDVALGPSGARNRGLEASSAPVVAFLDDDDIWLPTKLAAVMSCFADHPEVGVVAHKVAMADAAISSRSEITVVAKPVRRFLLSQPPHLSGVAIRRELHEMVRFDEDFWAAEDLDYLIRLAGVTSFAFVDAVYARHGKRVDDPSLIAIDRRIEARRQLRAKHDALFDRRADAFHLMRLGHLYRRAGRRSNALASFAQAAARCPTLGHAWRGIVLSTLPDKLVRRLVA